MRIAYVGNFEPPWSTENDIRIALESMEHQVIQLQENKTKPMVLRRTALNCDLLLWTSTWDEAQPLGETLDTIHELAKAGIPSVAYHLDTFWQTSRSKRKWWRNPMWRMSHVFTADGDWQHEYELSGIHHHWLPAGVRHTAAIDGVPRREFMCDVAFVGNDGVDYHREWPYRRTLILALEDMCIRNGWSFKNPGGRQPKVPRDQMADFYASAKVTVGDSLCLKKEASSYWSDRAYEAPARRGLLIMPNLPLLNDEYDGALPMYPWGDFHNLEQQVGRFLESPGARALVTDDTTAAARESHTYVNRMETIFEKVIT